MTLFFVYMSVKKPRQHTMALLPSVLTKGNSELYSFSNFTFTNAGVTGRNGPTLAQVQSSYIAANPTQTWTQNTSFLNMTTQGIQRWTVPATGNYTITVLGAKGGLGRVGVSGNGARMIGTFALTQSNVIQIMVGQMGTNGSDQGGGGGGSFVVHSDGTPLIIAGGGGGGQTNGTLVGGDAAGTTSTTGNSGSSISGNTPGSGGTGGAGGNRATAPNTGASGAGGGGLTGNGQNGWTSSPFAFGGLSFSNGGVGGFGYDYNGNTSNGFAGPGGFGGGGGGDYYYWTGGGGGGGYSGGGGGTYYGFGGGGGSYNVGTSQSNTGGFNNTHGSVVITKL